jgi:hypothetical protein
VIGAAYLNDTNTAFSGLLRATIRTRGSTSSTEITLNRNSNEAQQPTWRSEPILLEAFRTYQVLIEALDSTASPKPISQHTIHGLTLKQDKTALLLSVLREPRLSSTNENRAPRIIALLLDTTRITPPSPVTFTMQATDDPHQSLTYQWQATPPKNGVFGNANTSQVTWIASMSPPDPRVSFRATVRDHRQGIASVVVTLPVQDKSSEPFSFHIAPHIDSLTISRPFIEPLGSTELSVRAVSTLPKSALTYAWHLPHSGCKGKQTGSGQLVQWTANANWSGTDTCPSLVQVKDRQGEERPNFLLRGATSQWVFDTTSPRPSTIRSIVSDPKGNAYVAGTFYKSIIWEETTLRCDKNTRNIFVFKVDPQGNMLWSWHTNEQADVDVDDLVLDNKQNVYITGSFSQHMAFGIHTFTSRGNTDAFVAKLTSSGLITHAVQIGGPNKDKGYALTSTSDGQLLVGGTFGKDAYFQTNAMTTPIKPPHKNINDLFLAAIDQMNTKGKWLWVQAAGADISFAEERITHIQTTKSGSFIVAGVFSGDISFGTFRRSTTANTGIFVAEASKDGKWTRVHVPKSTGETVPTGLAQDSDGTIFLTGAFNHTLTFGSTTYTANNPNVTHDMFVASLAKDGSWNWSLTVQDRFAVQSHSLQIGPDQHLYLTGDAASQAAFWDNTLPNSPQRVGFVGSLTRKGTWRWKEPIKGAAENGIRAYDIAFSGANRLWVGGWYYINLTFRKIHLPDKADPNSTNAYLLHFPLPVGKP